MPYTPAPHKQCCWLLRESRSHGGLPPVDAGRGPCAIYGGHLLELGGRRFGPRAPEDQREPRALGARRRRAVADLGHAVHEDLVELRREGEDVAVPHREAHGDTGSDVHQCELTCGTEGRAHRDLRHAVRVTAAVAMHGLVVPCVTVEVQARGARHDAKGRLHARHCLPQRGRRRGLAVPGALALELHAQVPGAVPLREVPALWQLALEALEEAEVRVGAEERRDAEGIVRPVLGQPFRPDGRHRVVDTDGGVPPAAALPARPAS
mmetsp:Transcript_5271/g.16118  ORF Transcript_5271/g.16118 Transcript_5271/m.16118 type:complete len:265 (+) Transcript_5271:105-899(+)